MRAPDLTALAEEAERRVNNPFSALERLLVDHSYDFVSYDDVYLMCKKAFDEEHYFSAFHTIIYNHKQIFGNNAQTIALDRMDLLMNVQQLRDQDVPLYTVAEIKGMVDYR